MNKQETLEEAAKNYVNYCAYNISEDEDLADADKRGFMEGAKWQQERKVNILDKVNRVEVIQHSPPHNGRAYTNYNAKDVEIQFQDDGKTLKIFLI